MTTTNGPVALVTGASRGIGRATALALGLAGYRVGVAGTARHDLEETRDLLAERGAFALDVSVDVRDSISVRDAVAEVEERVGAISVLVNNAGSLRAVGPLWEVDPGDWWNDVQTSLGGAFLCCREVLPGMIARSEGRIVNIVSYAAVHPSPYLPGYAPAKAGLASLTEGLAASLEGTGVKAFSVAPGFTDTAATRHLLESEAGRRWLPETQGREFIDPELTTRLIVWLASGGGDALSGRFLHSLDDRSELLARLEEIRVGDLYAPRLRRL